MQLLSQLKWVIRFVNWKSESRCDQRPARLAIVEHAGVKTVSVQNQAKNYPNAGACRLPTWHGKPRRSNGTTQGQGTPRCRTSTSRPLAESQDQSVLVLWLVRRGR